MALPVPFRTSSVRTEYSSILFYAAAKLGKTTIAGETTPDAKFGLWTEDGDTQGLQSISHIDVNGVEIRNWPTFDEVCAELGRVPGKCQYQGFDIDNLLVDSYSCCGHLWMDDALSKLGWKEIGLGRGRASLQPYAYVAEKGRQTTKKLLNLIAINKVNVIVVAREGVYETGMGSEDYKSVPCIELPGAKLHSELPGSFDAVIRMRSINGVRVFVTQEEGGAIAGLRVPKDFGPIPKYIKPDISLVQRCIRGDRSVLSELKAQSPTKPDSVQLNR